MRTSLRKGAYAALFSAAWQEIRVRSGRDDKFALGKLTVSPVDASREFLNELVVSTGAQRTGEICGFFSVLTQTLNGLKDLCEELRNDRAALYSIVASPAFSDDSIRHGEQFHPFRGGTPRLQRDSMHNTIWGSSLLESRPEWLAIGTLLGMSLGQAGNRYRVAFYGLRAASRDDRALGEIPTLSTSTNGNKERKMSLAANSVHTLCHEMGSSSRADITPIVFVVDDDISVRESLDLLIRCAGWQPETFASAIEFLNHPKALVPSCLVLDVSLPGLSGLDLQKRVAVERADMPVIFITGYGDVRTTVQAMKAGAAEFLTKPFDDGVLLSAIRQAIERSRIALAHEARMRALRECYTSLSRREREVMTLVASGLLNKQVGSELGISEITVKAHRGRVMEKMKAETIVELVKMAGRLRLAYAPRG
jgi:FixJ family two-component response regulator